MNKRMVGVLLFALVVAGLASTLVYKLIATRLAAAIRTGETRVIAAARDLPVGTLVKDSDVKAVEWTGSLPVQALVKTEDAIGRGVVANIYSGEAILENRLAPKGAGAGMAATIPVGMRAVAVRVNDVVGVAGFVTPGMRVDVLILGNPPGGAPAHGTLSKTLLQNIEVLSAGQQIQKDVEGKPAMVPVVNLLVTPEHAEILSLASNDARIQLVLRNPLDREEAKTTGVAMARLFTGQFGMPQPDTPRPRSQAKARVAPPIRPPEVKKLDHPPIVIVVEVLHGAKKTESKFAEKEKEN